MPSLSRLQHVIDELDRTLGAGYAREHPDVAAAMLISTAIDAAAATIAAALVEEPEGAIVPLLRAGLNPDVPGYPRPLPGGIGDSQLLEIVGI